MKAPVSGVRYVVDREEGAEGSGVPVYRGFAHLPDRSIALEVRLPEGAAVATLAPDTDLSEETRRDLEKEAAALVRAATKAALASGAVPPRRIARWRG